MMYHYEYTQTIPCPELADRWHARLVLLQTMDSPLSPWYCTVGDESMYMSDNSGRRVIDKVLIVMYMLVGSAWG